MSFIRDNLGPRLRLMRTAVARRFIHDEIAAMARAQGIPYLDVAADTEPFEFVAAALGDGTSAGSAPDFSRQIEPAGTFTPPGAPELFHSEPSVGRFLGQLVFHRNAQTVVELGCFAGWATAHMALALKAAGTGRLWALDYRQEYLDAAMANLRRHGLESQVTPIRGMSCDPGVLSRMPRDIDVVFLDTGHSYPDTRDEILAYASRLAPGGCIVLHDSTSAPGVRRSVQEVLARFRAFTFATERSNGITVLTPRGPR